MAPTGNHRCSAHEPLVREIVEIKTTGAHTLETVQRIEKRLESQGQIVATHGGMSKAAGLVIGTGIGLLGLGAAIGTFIWRIAQ